METSGSWQLKPEKQFEANAANATVNAIKVPSQTKTHMLAVSQS